MAIFKLNEEKLRAAFAESKQGNEPEGYGWVAPFDPIAIDPLWDRFGGPAVDYLEAQIREVRAASE